MTLDADYMAEIVDRMMKHENYLFGRNDIAEDEELLSDKFQAHTTWLEEAWAHRYLNRVERSLGLPPTLRYRA